MNVKLTAFLLAAAFLPMTGHAQTANPTGDKPLSAYRDKNRVLVVFASAPQDAAYQEQTKLWQGEKAGFEDRQLVVTPVFAGAKGASPKVMEPLVPLMKKYGIGPDDFAVVLIGKDGHDAYHVTKPTAAPAIYAVIDAMPMRRVEIKHTPTASPSPSATPRRPDLDHDE